MGWGEEDACDSHFFLFIGKIKSHLLLYKPGHRGRGPDDDDGAAANQAPHVGRVRLPERPRAPSPPPINNPPSSSVSLCGSTCDTGLVKCHFEYHPLCC